MEHSRVGVSDPIATLATLANSLSCSTLLGVNIIPPNTVSGVILILSFNNWNNDTRGRLQPMTSLYANRDSSKRHAGVL